MSTALLLAYLAAAQSGDPAAPTTTTPSPAPAGAAAATTTTVQPANTTKEGRLKLVLLDLDANGVDASTVKTITDVISTAFARDKALDVVTAADLRAMMNVDAAKQANGACNAGDSCMAEIASALGADLVVHGSVGALGGLTVVNVSVFDARKSSAVGREKVQSANPAELSTLLEGAVAKLAANVDAAGAKAGSAKAEDAGSSGVLLWSGVGVGALGLVVGGAGGLLASSEFSTLEDPASARKDKDNALGLYPAMLTTGIVGGAALVAGAGLVVAGVLGGGP